MGVSVAYFKTLYPDARVVPFEPDREVYDYLSRNLSRNNLLENVVLHNAAVWTHSKGVNFASDGADGGHVEECPGGRVVPSIDLKEMLLGEKCVDLLKMDIEGAETVVIPALKDVLSHVRRLFCEYHSWGVERNGTLGSILAILDEAGFRYRLAPVEGSMATPFEHQGSPWRGNIFAANEGF